MNPNWLGSPQHLVGGIILGAAASVYLRSRIPQWWLVAVSAIGMVSTAEIVVELAEYPLLYAGELRVTAYLDTLADLAATVVGGVIGAAVGIISQFVLTGKRSR